MGLHVIYLLFLSAFNKTWISSTDFRKIPKSTVMKIRPVGAKLLHADRRTDMTMIMFDFVISRKCLKIYTRMKNRFLYRISFNQMCSRLTTTAQRLYMSNPLKPRGNYYVFDQIQHYNIFFISLGAFAKLRKESISFIISVYPSVLPSVLPSDRPSVCPH
jgi:hypothetical protein